MFTPLVLACMVEAGSCAVFGGVAFEDENRCWAEAIDYVIPRVMEVGPDLIIVDVRCMSWVDPGEPA